MAEFFQVGAQLRASGGNPFGPGQRRLERLAFQIEAAVATAQRMENALPQQVADFYVQFGRCRRMLGEALVARQWYERAITLRRNLLHDDAGVAEGMIYLAMLDGDAARTGVAIERFLDARRQLRARVGDRHPLMVDIQRNLGALYLERGQAAEAESVLRTGLSLASDLHGAGHPVTLAVRRQLGLAYLQLGRLAEAEQALHAQHGPTETLLGPRHRETGHDPRRLGQEPGAPADAGRHRGRGRHVAPTPILLQGRPDEALDGTPCGSLASRSHPGRDASHAPKRPAARRQ